MHSDLMANSLSTDAMNPQPAPPGTTAESVINRADRLEGTSAAAQITALAAENRELRAELDQARADRNHLLDLQRQILQLLGTTRSEKILHDLRNLLNERDLLKALTDEM